MRSFRVLGVAVIFVNRFFYPDVSATSQLLSDLAFDVASKQKRVHVITSRLLYEGQAATELAAGETVNGVTVHRIWTSRFGRARLAGRAIDYLTFYLSAFWRLLCLARRGDVVVAKTDPPLLSVIAAPVCLLRGARLVNWLQDLFPEVAQVAGLARRAGAGYSILRWARTASLRLAAADVAIGHRMAERLRAMGVRDDRIRVIPNWADPAVVWPIPPADNPVRQGFGLGAAFVVAYSGNLGRVHDIATMIGAMEVLSRPLAPERSAEACPAIHWLFIGGGALTPALKAEVSRRAFANVTFLPYQPRSSLAQSLSAGDAHIASLKPAFEGLVVPSKVSGATAAGRPILFIGDPEGEIGQLIARYRCGYTIVPGDGEGLAQAITALARDRGMAEAMGGRARQAFEREFDRTDALARWNRLLNDVSDGPGAP